MKCQQSLDKFFKSEEPDTKKRGVTWSSIERKGLRVEQAVVVGAARCREEFLHLEREVEYLTGRQAEVRVFGKVHRIPR